MSAVWERSCPPPPFLRALKATDRTSDAIALSLSLCSNNLGHGMGTRGYNLYSPRLARETLPNPIVFVLNDVVT